MTSSSLHRSGHDFRAFVQDSIAGQQRLHPVGRRRKVLQDKIKAFFSPRLGARLTTALREQLEGELAFCADISARVSDRASESWRRRSDAPAPAEIAPPVQDWAYELEQEFETDFETHFEPAVAPERMETPSKALVFLRVAGRIAHGIGVVLWPVARFIYAQRNWVLRLAGLGLAALAAAGVFQQWQDAQPAPRPAASAPPRAVWLEIARPYQAYDLAAPQLAHEKLAYAARRQSIGGGREDSLTFGEFGGKKIFLRLSVYRHGAEKKADAPFFVDMARRAAPLGLSIVRTDVDEAQPTRFGEMQMAALSLSAGQTTRENCQGFRMIQNQKDTTPGLTIGGLACAAPDETLNAAELACLVDRLDLLAAEDDKPLRDFFGAAQARRVRGCGSVSRK